MNECLVCQKEKNTGPIKCKLCNMGFRSGARHNGFDFCCNNCVRHFKRISRVSGGKIEEKRSLI